MKLILLIFCLNINFSKEKKRRNGVYNIMFDEQYLYYYKRKIFLSENFKHPNTFFRIRKVINDFHDVNNEILYNIEEIYTKFNLGYLDNKELIFGKKSTQYNLWEFIEINSNSFVIHNKNNCYV